MAGGYAALQSEKALVRALGGALGVLGVGAELLVGVHHISEAQKTVTIDRIVRTYKQVFAMAQPEKNATHVYGDEYFGGFTAGFLNTGGMNGVQVVNDPTIGFWIVPIVDPTVVYIYFKQTPGGPWQQIVVKLNGPAPDTAPRFSPDEIWRIESSLLVNP
jgi:hypothetical protein